MSRSTRLSQALLQVLATLSLLNTLVYAAGPTSIFINQVPSYSSLDACALKPLSAIVRGMTSGCGDGSRTTSYACFCSSSSAHFQSVISTEIMSGCNADLRNAQVTTASEVFNSYCHLGDGNIISAVTTTAVSGGKGCNA